MSKLAGSNKVRSFLASSGVLDEVGSGETCIVLVPTARVKAARLVQLLRSNGVELRTLGHGAGRMRDRYGVERNVRGLAVLAVPHKFVKRAQLYIKLFGAFSVCVDKPAEAVK